MLIIMVNILSAITQMVMEKVLVKPTNTVDLIVLLWVKKLIIKD